MQKNDHMLIIVPKVLSEKRFFTLSTFNLLCLIGDYGSKQTASVLYLSVETHWRVIISWEGGTQPNEMLKVGSGLCVSEGKILPLTRE